MQSLETLSGKLHITLHYGRTGDLCAVNTVSIHSNRLRLSPRFFAGKPVETAPKLVGMLFSLCGTAQSVASARACEQALGQPVSPATEQQRDFQVRGETLFEHLLRLSQDWTMALGCEPPAPAELQALFRLKRDLLQVVDLQPVLVAIQQWMETHLLGMPTAEWLECCHAGDVKKLSMKGGIGNIVSSLQAMGWDRLGDVEIHPLPELPVDWWLQRLIAVDAENFMAEPEVDGQACETSALTRHWENPDLQVWREHYGSGLMTRLIARVLDMVESVSTPHPNLPPQGGKEQEATPNRASSLPSPLAGEGPGMGGTTPQAGISLVQTVRGLLTHRVTQQNAIICNYQIVAPTEWNFHPLGSLYNMLATLQGRDETDLTQQARILITALDPCVDYQLEIIPDA
ncbi:nickel-dependent hydrogenase large subunit [Thiothrix nivea]|uniref:Nickel-dependent hydrogenase large subunit n=1 Tax=Thiothrix nivea (strain ATCC 35100 / DSM 5205 / JP2) TaxID=870187 RepID=A0A656H8K8_THINJ|nr:nickel-dependent hydrogenase large subunit [Thiothrix nivea]EIJ32921.1 nickel-dependent hydrogenase large subunit [Thiothrix nivea DSM 5205]